MSPTRLLGHVCRAPLPPPDRDPFWGATGSLAIVFRHDQFSATAQSRDSKPTRARPGRHAEAPKRADGGRPERLGPDVPSGNGFRHSTSGFVCALRGGSGSRGRGRGRERGQECGRARAQERARALPRSPVALCPFWSAAGRPGGVPRGVFGRKMRGKRKRGGARARLLLGALFGQQLEDQAGRAAVAAVADEGLRPLRRPCREPGKACGQARARVRRPCEGGPSPGAFVPLPQGRRRGLCAPGRCAVPAGRGAAFHSQRIRMARVAARAAGKAIDRHIRAVFFSRYRCGGARSGCCTTPAHNWVAISDKIKGTHAAVFVGTSCSRKFGHIHLHPARLLDPVQFWPQSPRRLTLFFDGFRPDRQIDR